MYSWRENTLTHLGAAIEVIRKVGH
jgi:hypothetical protein